MPHSRIVVIGASAGGFEAVRALLSELREGFPAAILVVIHTGSAGILPDSLGRMSILPVSLAEDAEPLQDGRVFIAPADRHLTVADGVVRVSKGPREHGFRPAVDPLFISAAQTAGARVAGVVLSGALSDGTIGLHAIKQAGGFTVVQSPEEAAFPSMPLSALRSVPVDAVLPARQIGRELMEWAMNGTARLSRRQRRDRPAGAHAKGRIGRHPKLANPQLMAFTCPSCGGAISEVQELGFTHYECHVGHRFDGESLVALGDERTENTLWKAVRALQEQALLRRRMIARARGREALSKLAREWEADAADSERRADQIRRLIEGTPVPGSAQLAQSAAGQASGNGRRRVSRASRRGHERAPAPTVEQARDSKRLHQESRRTTRTAKATLSKDRATRPATDGGRNGRSRKGTKRRH